jgi:uncharacterized protein (TIGR01777 family)
MDTILISGGSSLIGRHLGRKLKGKGYRVILLCRSKKPDAVFQTYYWNPGKSEVPPEAISGCDYIIHLAGAGIGDKRWTGKRKNLIVESRVRTAQLLFEKIRHNKNKPRAFITSSAVGYYGTITSERIYVETDPPSRDFLGTTCRQWEAAADRYGESGIRVVKIRTGVVLAQKGGALARMIAPVKVGFGSAIGDGRQYFPWIHIDDLCGIYARAVEDTNMTGAYNAVAPEHITNHDFMIALAHKLKRPFWFPNIPTGVMKLLFGEMSEILLKGSRIYSERIREAGFEFRFPCIDKALDDLLEKK